MKQSIYLIALCLGGLWSAWVQGAAVEGLYEAEIPVADTSAAARQEAMRAGLAQVVIKVSGLSRTGEDPAVAELMAAAPRYVQQYRYLERENKAQARGGVGRELAENGEKMQPERLLWMRFDAATLNQQLRDRGLPIWGEARPMLLGWLALEEGGKRLLVSATDAGLARQMLEQRATERGVPLRLPLMDLRDRSMVTPADVWGGFHDSLLKASEYYQAQAVLVGRLYHDRSRTWHSQWTLYLGDEVLRWNRSGSEADKVLAAGIDGSADALAQRFAQAASAVAGSTLDLYIDGVADIRGLTRALDYLASVSGVSQVLVDEVKPTAVRCRLTLASAPDNVIRNIALGETLEALPTPPLPRVAVPPSPAPGVEPGAPQAVLPAVPDPIRHYRLSP